MPFSERQIELHKDLISFLYGELEDKVVEQIIKNVSEKDETLSGMKSLSEVIDRWHSQYKMGILDYGILIEALKEVDEIPLVGCIEDKIQEIENAAPKRGVEEDESPTQAKFVKSKTIDRDPSDGKWKIIDGLEYYETENKTGFLLVLHFYEDRTGLENDLENLTNLFEKTLGFDTLVLPYKETEVGHLQRMNDLTSEQLTSVLEKVRAYLQKKHKQYYCFLCIILSHGDKDTIKTADSPYQVHDIRQMFSNIQFENFKGKPKVFIIQACQGKEIQGSVEVDDQSDNEDNQKEVTHIDLADQIVFLPKDADTLIIFATTPGHFARGNTIDGETYLIRHFVDVVNDHHRIHHLEDMLITVRDRASKDELFDTSMMPYTWSTLTKRLMFMPGTQRLEGSSSQRRIRIDSNGGVHIDALENL